MGATNISEGFSVRDIEECQAQANKIAKSAKEISTVLSDYVRLTTDLVDIGANNAEVKEMYGALAKVADELAENVETGSIRHMILFIDDQMKLTGYGYAGQ